MLYVLMDNISSHKYGVCVAERPAIPTPKRKNEFIEVDGRHGSLVKKGAYEDISLSVPFNMLEKKNIKQQVRTFKGYLINKKTLQFSDDDVYYKIKDIEIGDIENEVDFYGNFSVTFRLDPFQYAIESIETITEKQNIFNHGTIESEPRLKIYATGNVRLFVNDASIYLENVEEFIVLDTDLLEAYKGSKPMNNKMTGEFPMFEVGKNIIYWIGNVSKIEIEARRRYV